MNNSRVIISSNDNLKERKHRLDKVHLTERGVSRLANNLKYRIAAALEITVIKKRMKDDHIAQLHNRNDSRGGNWENRRWYA